MDTSTIGKSVFDEALALAKATGSSLMLLHVLSLGKGSPNLLHFPAWNTIQGWQNPEIHQEQWKTFEEHGLELLRTR